MRSFENDPPSEDDLGIEDYGFSWEDGIESERLSPLDLAMIDEISVPVRRALSQIGEITTDFQRRLEEMRVENPKAVSRRTVRKLEHLYLQKYALEDIHYHAYQSIKEKSTSPYISVSFEDIIRFSPSDASQVKILQIKQTFEAYGELVDLGLNQQQVYDLITKGIEHGNGPTGNENEKYWVRCLARLLTDRHLEEFSAKLPNQSRDRGASNSLSFEEVAGRAVTIINRKYLTHTENMSGKASLDARMWNELERRDLERVMSFARPIMGIAPTQK
jgi:hypothetical protein